MAFSTVCLRPHTTIGAGAVDLLTYKLMGGSQKCTVVIGLRCVASVVPDGISYEILHLETLIKVSSTFVKQKQDLKTKG